MSTDPKTMPPQALECSGTGSEPESDAPRSLRATATTGSGKPRSLRCTFVASGAMCRTGRDPVLNWHPRVVSAIARKGEASCFWSLSISSRPTDQLGILRPRIRLAVRVVVCLVPAPGSYVAEIGLQPDVKVHSAEHSAELHD